MNPIIETTRDRALDASRWIASRVREHAGTAWSHLETLRNKATAATKGAAASAEEAVDDAVKEVKQTAKAVSTKVETEVKEAKKAATKTVAKATTAKKASAKMTKAELYEIATDLDIAGRSGMKKAELLAAIKDATK